MTSSTVQHVWRCLECRAPLGVLVGKDRLRFSGEVEITAHGVWVKCECGQGRWWRFRNE